MISILGDTLLSFNVDVMIHCSLLRTCRVRVEEKEEFLVYTVLWTLTCHPYLESASALSDNLSEITKLANAALPTKTNPTSANV